MSANMLSQRAFQISTRRLAAVNPSVMSKALRMASPAAIAMGQIRQAATASGVSTTISSSEGTEILAAQRRNRPVSPHLSIYQPQITWLGSILNRITGCILSGGFYIFGFGYLVAPYVGLHWESATFAAAVAAWPIWLKVATKATLAFPFTYHSINGIRHLIWDMGAMFTNKQVMVTGWTVMAISALTALGLVFY